MAACSGPAGSSNRVPVAFASQMFCWIFERFFRSARIASLQSSEMPFQPLKILKPVSQVAIFDPKPYGIPWMTF
jgi:hypothetical protein